MLLRTLDVSRLGCDNGLVIRNRGSRGHRLRCGCRDFGELRLGVGQGYGSAALSLGGRRRCRLRSFDDRGLLGSELGLNSRRLICSSGDFSSPVGLSASLGEICV